MLRRVASWLPPSVVGWLNRAQFRHPWTARPLRYLARRVAHGEGVISDGPAKGLRIDATGRNAGYVLGTADRDEQLWLAKNLGRDQSFYDIGANIGFFTLLGAKLVGPAGTVVAFEPLPVNAEQLRRNVVSNGLDHVTVVQAAVAARNGVAAFGSEAGRRDASQILEKTDAVSTSIQVPIVSIDGWCDETGQAPPVLMKIDAEGAEIDVLRGSHGTIEAYRPTILIEVHWLGESFVDYVREALLPLSYSARTLDGHHLPTDPVRFHAVLRPEDRS